MFLSLGFKRTLEILIGVIQDYWNVEICTELVKFLGIEIMI
ncbi:protein of unknown function [Clostridium beijerinckii]|nr:protein of unknown function [Clostridium beijerinckii]